MARCSSTGRSRVAMTTETLGREPSAIGVPLRVAVAETEGGGDGSDDPLIALGELRLPGLVEAQGQRPLVEPHRVAGHGVVDAEEHLALAEEGEALGEDGLAGMGQDPLQVGPGVGEHVLVAEDRRLGRRGGLTSAGMKWFGSARRWRASISVASIWSQPPKAVLPTRLQNSQSGTGTPQPHSWPSISPRCQRKTISPAEQNPGSWPRM